MKNEFGCKINASYVENGDEWNIGIKYDDSLGTKVDYERSSDNGDNLEDLAFEFTERLMQERDRLQKEQEEMEKPCSKDDIIEELQRKVEALEAEKKTLIEHNQALHKPKDNLSILADLINNEFFL